MPPSALAKSPRLSVVPNHPRWWDEAAYKSKNKDGGARQIAGTIAQVVGGMRARQQARIAQLVVAARLYGNSRLLGAFGAALGSISQRPRAVLERLTDNVIESVVDTCTARVGEEKPRPFFLTDGGSWTLQRKAKQLNRFAEGMFYESNAYSLGSDCQRDGEVFGDGWAHVFERNDRVCVERCLSAELWVDEMEAIYGRPRQLHRMMVVDREQLAAQFPDYEDEIRNAPRAKLIDEGFPQNDADMIEVTESWHLRSGPEAEDGKHCISIDGCLILPMEEWEHDFFPFARWRWASRPLGFWSQGIPERLQGKQIEINRLLWTIQEAMRRAGSYKVFIEAGSKVVKQHVSNDIGAMVEYKGTPPTWFVPSAVSPEHYEQWQRLRQSMYEQEGVPLMMATGQKPAGLNSAPGQRMYRDTAAELMKTRQRFNQDGYMELARMMIAVARSIALRTGGAYEVRTPSNRAVTSVRMTASDLDPSGWEMKCFPVSSLPKDPAGRTETVTEWVQAGWLTQRQAKKLMDFPDLEAVETLENAAEDIISKTLDAICDEGEYAPPEPTDDLQLAMQMSVEYLNRGRAQGLEEERMDLLRNYKIQVETLLSMLAAAMAPPPMMGPGQPQLALGPGAPQGVPTAPPVSELLPNAPGAM